MNAALLQKVSTSNTQPAKSAGTPRPNISWPTGKLAYPKDQLTPKIDTLFDLFNALTGNKVVAVKYMDCFNMRSPHLKIIRLMDSNGYMMFLLHHMDLLSNEDRGIKVGIKLQHPISDEALNTIFKKYRSQAHENVQPLLRIVPTASAHAPQPVVKSTRYRGEYLEDDKMREFLKHLQKQNSHKPDIIIDEEIRRVLRKFFKQHGCTKHSLDGFLQVNFEAFAIKTHDQKSWQINWQEVTAFIHGEPRPKKCKPIVLKVENLSLMQRVALHKAQPALKVQFAELETKQAAIEAEITKRQTQLDTLRLEIAQIKAQLQCQPFTPEELAAMEGVVIS